MDKTYTPRDIEERIYRRWEEQGLFAPSGDGAPFCIVIPPPNVTGTLHMGHAFQDTIMDALTRFHRMAGRRTLWQPGTDHAGIATQMVVERQLLAEGASRHALGREAFVERVWRWKEESGGTIARQLRRLGASVDWSRDRFTMDPAAAAKACEFLGVKQVVPMHWGTFPLLTGTPEELRKLVPRGVDVLALSPGETAE